MPDTGAGQGRLACGGMNQAHVRVERREGVAVLTVSDPARRNALTPALSTELADMVKACEADETVGALVIAGDPPAFCAGADLSLLGAGATPEDREAGLRAIYSGFLAVASCALPTVAAVDGPAVGAGLNLALACDVRLAGPAARFDARFLRLGLHPGGGMTWMVQRAIGPQAAAALALFGDVVSATEAERIGLVYRAVDGDVLVAAIELAARAAIAPRELVMTTKRTMRKTATIDQHADAVQTELGPQVESLSSPAFLERIAAARRR
jgi:enoyl-CoA hydratase